MENLWVVETLLRTLLRSSQRSARPGEEGAYCPVPKNPTTLSAFGRDFRALEPHLAASPIVISPNS